MGLLSLSAECCAWKCQHAICAHSRARTLKHTHTDRHSPNFSPQQRMGHWSCESGHTASGPVHSLRQRQTLPDARTECIWKPCWYQSLFKYIFCAKIVLFFKVNLSCYQSQKEYCWHPCSQTCKLTKRNGLHLQGSQEQQLWLHPPPLC